MSWQFAFLNFRMIVFDIVFCLFCLSIISAGFLLRVVLLAVLLAVLLVVLRVVLLGSV
jgi:hypothetical protein